MSDNRPFAFTRRQFIAASSAMALGAGIMPRAAARSSIPAERAWKHLAESLSGELLRPGDTGFKTVTQPRSLRYAHIQPAAIVRCKNAQDIAKAIRWCVDNRLALAVRSGGHSYAGFSTTRGLLIDVSSMRGAEFDPASGRLRIEAGARTTDIYAAMRPHNVAITHPRCSTVGIAGFLLGGGIGFNMREHGLGCDQIIASEIVTADGTLKKLGPDENAELFWACRGGGGGNFGVNSSFALQTFSIDRMTSFAITWKGKSEEVFAALMLALDAAPIGLGARISLQAVTAKQFASGEDVAIDLLGQFGGTPQDVRDILAPAYAIAPPAKEEIVASSYWEAQDRLTGEGSPSYFQERSTFTTEALNSKAIATAFRWLRKWPGTGVGADLRFFQTGGKINTLDAGATAFVHRSSKWLMLVGLYWTPKDEAERRRLNRDWQDGFYDAMLPFSTRGAYQNFPDPSLREWQSAYYGANLPRLARIKAAADPEGIFRFAQSIPTQVAGKR